MCIYIYVYICVYTYMYICIIPFQFAVWHSENLATYDVLAALEVTQGQILIQYPTDVPRFWWHLHGSWLKKPSTCPWVASRAVMGVEHASAERATGYGERPFVGVSEARSWSHWLIFVRDYRQKLTNLLEIDI